MFPSRFLLGGVAELTAVDLGDLPFAKAATIVFDELCESRGCCVVVDVDLVTVLAGMFVYDAADAVDTGFNARFFESAGASGIIVDTSEAETPVNAWRVGEGGRPMEGATLSFGNLCAFSRGLRNIAFLFLFLVFAVM